MIDSDLHWLAGWLEGEGSFVATSGEGSNGKRYRRITVRGVSTDLEVINSVQKRAGVGRVYGPYNYGSNRQPHWQWAVCSRKDALAFMAMIRPYMSTRRQAQIDAATLKGEETVC